MGKEFPWKREVQDVSVWDPNSADREGGRGVMGRRGGKGEGRGGEEERTERWG